MLAQGKREKPAGQKGKGKGRRDKGEKGKSTTYDLTEISLDQAPRARTYARTARHDTISRLRGACRTNPPTSDIAFVRKSTSLWRPKKPREQWACVTLF